MADKSFVAVNWTSRQLIDEDTLNQMNNNLVYLRDTMTTGAYQHENAGLTQTGLKILCGKKIVPASKEDTASIRISFPTLFTPNTKPIVTTSINSSSGKANFSHVIQGINDGDEPNHQGFRVKVVANYAKEKADRIDKTLWVHWIAMGY